MANSAKTKAAVVKETPAKQVQPVESIYTAEELANNHKAFNAPYEIVAVALRLAGKKTATFSEAEKIIDRFKNKEVK